MLELKQYRILAKKFAKGEVDNNLELFVWMAKWFARTYGVSLETAYDMTPHDLFIEYFASPYFKDMSLLDKDGEVDELEQRAKEDAEWAAKLDKQQELVDPKVKQLLEENKKKLPEGATAEKIEDLSPEDRAILNKFKPMEFGEGK